MYHPPASVRATYDPLARYLAWIRVAADEKHLPNLTMKHFAEVKSPLLNTLILVRNPVFWLASKLSNKYKLEAAVDGELNHISIAYHSRAMPLHS